MTLRTLFLPLALCLGLAAPTPLHAAEPSDEALQKVVKTVINAIRFKKDDLAAKQISFAKMAEMIFGEHWKDVSEADRKEVAAGLETIVRKISFKKGRDLFEHLDTISYDKPRRDGGRVNIKSTVVVHKELKKAEVVIDFVLAEEGGPYRIVDTVMLGQSTGEGIREDQIEPLLQQGGVPAVMKALRDKLAELG